MFPLSMLKVGALTCARATPTLPSSRNADANNLFMMLPSEGWPHAWIQPRSYGKQHHGPLSMPFQEKEDKREKDGSPAYRRAIEKVKAFRGIGAGRTLATMSQIVVGLVQPVFARGIEDVEVHGIFQSPGLVRHVRRDAQHFAGANDDLLAIDGKLQRAFEDIGHLLVVVVMQRHVRAFLHQHARQHDFIADQHFAADEGIELLALHAFPRDVLRFRRGAHFFSPYNFAALSCRYRRASSTAFSSVKAPSATSSASAAATAVRAERAASQKVSSAPTASLNGKASDPNMIFSGYSEIHCLRMLFNSEG